MSKLTIIQLLNKIAKGEEVPKKIKYKEDIYEYYKSSETIDYRYLDEETQGYGYLSSCIDYDTFSCLNDEVEVIEDNKKIEKISWKEKESLAGFIRNDNDKLDILARRTEKLKKSLNEIIEVLNDKN